MQFNATDTWAQAVYDIKMSFDREGAPPVESRLSDYQIYDKFRAERAAYYKRTKVNRQGINPQCYQTIPCVPLVKADQDICPCTPPSGCKWLRSKNPIPKAIFLKSVTNTSADFEAKYVEWSQFSHKLNGRSYDPTDRYYTFLDTGDGSYLYLFDKKLAHVAMTGMFEDPTQAAAYLGCKKLTKRQVHLLCNPIETPLYTDGQAYSVIYKMVFDWIAKTLPVSTVDHKVDYRDNASGENKK